MKEKIKQEIYQKIKEGNTFKSLGKEYGIESGELRRLFIEQKLIAQQTSKPTVEDNSKYTMRNNEIFQKILSGKTMQELCSKYGLSQLSIVYIFVNLCENNDQINTPDKKRILDIYKLIESGKRPDDIAYKLNVPIDYIFKKYFKPRKTISKK